VCLRYTLHDGWVGIGNIALTNSSVDQGEPVSVVADTALRAILKSLGTAPSFRECMRECALTLHQSTHADGATIFRLAEDDQALEQIHSVGFFCKLTELSRRIGLDGSLIGRAVQQRQILVSENLLDDSRIAAEVREELIAGGM
jgi:GAF domain-containing protein